MKLRSHISLAILLFVSPGLSAQMDSDNEYAKPLKDVLSDIETRYGVTIKYADSVVAEKTVKYADWRYRNDVEQTLDNVLKPLDMKVRKDGDRQYRVQYYEYYRWPVAEGWAELDRIASQYSTVAEWEKRKTELKPCMLE